MNHEFVDLPAFTCIGLQAEGLLHSAIEWVPRLWEELALREGEILHLERRGTWGLMSDPRIFLAPWGGQKGLYLACHEVPQGTRPFGDWKVWDIPATMWMRIPCRIDQIGEAMDHSRKVLRTDMNWQWSGAAHEFYPTGFSDPGRDVLHLMLALAPR